MVTKNLQIYSQRFSLLKCGLQSVIRKFKTPILLFVLQSIVQYLHKCLLDYKICKNDYSLYIICYSIQSCIIVYFCLEKCSQNIIQYYLCLKMYLKYWMMYIRNILNDTYKLFLMEQLWIKKNIFRAYIIQAVKNSFAR